MRQSWYDGDTVMAMAESSIKSAIRKLKGLEGYLGGLAHRPCMHQERSGGHVMGKRRRNPALLGGLIYPNGRAEGGLASG